MNIVLGALTGRQIDFDFSPIRADSYMPPDGRLRTRNFWDGLKQDDARAWAELNYRYDYLIAPVGSPADERLTVFFPQRRSVGGYAIFKSKMTQAWPK